MTVWNLKKYPPKTHPQSTYGAPESGLIYFVEGLGLGSDFGFPRSTAKKYFKWKKMNFTTDLPKQNPLVTYIVASAMKSAKIFPHSISEGPCFRMHAVVLANYEEQRKLNKGKGYILCHIRSACSSKEESITRKRSLDVDRRPDEKVEIKGVKVQHPSNEYFHEKTKVTSLSPILRPIRVLINNMDICPDSENFVDSCIQEQPRTLSSVELHAQLLEFLAAEDKASQKSPSNYLPSNFPTSKHFH